MQVFNDGLRMYQALRKARCKRTLICIKHTEKCWTAKIWNGTKSDTTDTSYDVILKISFNVKCMDCEDHLFCFDNWYQYIRCTSGLAPRKNCIHVQCRHLIPALNAARAKYTTARTIATQSPGHGCYQRARDLTTK